MTNIQRIIFLSFSALLLMPLTATAQVGKEQQQEEKKVINVNKLDVIYQDKDDEYQGVVIDQTSEEPAVSVPASLAPLPDEEDEELEKSSQLYVPEQMGDGVESEFDILYASMDYEVIHYASTAELPNGITIHLTEKEKGRKFCFPTPEHARLSSHFGGRKRRWHYGVDLAMPTGEPIYAAFDGIVRISKWNKSYGNLVVVRHFNGLETYYAHLSQRDVEAGDTVHAGQVIALCGNTGRSYGSHLHFEMRFMGKALNPEYVVDCENHKLYCDELTLTPAYFQKRGSSHASPSASDLKRINAMAGTAANNDLTIAENEQRDPSKPMPQVNKSKKSGAQYYKVRSGDTLSKIAKRNGTTVKRLCQLNGIKETTVLQIGKRLRVR